MAKLKQIAISTQDPDTVANFYKTVFKLEEIGRVDNDSAQGYYLSDGNINLAIKYFKKALSIDGEYELAQISINTAKYIMKLR